MAETRLRPLVGLPACIRESEGQSFHAVHLRYVAAVAEAAEALPLIIPALGDAHDIPGLVARLDGLFLTGSPSNVEPHHYGGATVPGIRHDRMRDETTLPLIREALRQGVPILAVCRGHEELNVALGGTLHQRVHEMPGKLDHRRPPNSPVEVEYGERHRVSLVEGGHLRRIAQGAAELAVNSLHDQAIDQVAPGLAVEAISEDGLVEAVRVEGAATFAIGVQWHPEWQALTKPFSRALFAEFRAAIEARAASREGSARRTGRAA